MKTIEEAIAEEQALTKEYTELNDAFYQSDKKFQSICHKFRDSPSSELQSELIRASADYWNAKDKAEYKWSEKQAYFRVTDIDWTINWE